MSVTRKRMARLEARWLRAIVQPVAEEYGLDVGELIADTRRFFALTDAEQDAEFAAKIAQAAAEGDAEHVHILQDGWEAIKSYR